MNVAKNRITVKSTLWGFYEHKRVCEWADS